jgi:adenylate cyclase
VREALRTALALDDNDSDVHRILAAVTLVHGDHEKASYHQERAIGLNPNDDLIVVQEGEILTWMGRPEEGIEWIRKAMRLNPYHPERFWGHLGRAFFVAHRYEEAIDAFKRIVAPDSTGHPLLAACYAQLDQPEKAKAQAGEALDLQPGFTVTDHMESQTYKRESDLAHHRDALLKAGLPG